MKYSDKLRDPRWQKKRLEILQRDEWICQRCFDSQSTLIVHHLRYIPGREPWEYDNRLLLTVCESCHNMEREARPEYEDMLLTVLKEKKFFADDIYALTCGFLSMEDLRGTADINSTIIEFFLKNQEAWKIVSDLYFKSLQDKKGK